MNPPDTISVNRAMLAVQRDRAEEMSGTLADGLHYFPLRVFYEDTDLSGAVYHARYLHFLERARSEFLRLAGIDQRAAFDKGMFVVSDVRLGYRRPARYGDLLTVVSRITRVRAAALDMDQRIVMLPQESGGEAPTLLDARLVVVFVTPPGTCIPDAQSPLAGRPQRLPAEWRTRFDALRSEAGCHAGQTPAPPSSPDRPLSQQTGTQA